MNLQQLIKTKCSCFDILENAILEFVRENGEEPSDYEIDEFGLDECRDGEEKITKIWNFFDFGGCYYIETAINQDFNPIADAAKDDGKNMQNLDQQLQDAFNYYAFQCLYIVVEDGVERLKYYRFLNSGSYFDVEDSEPDHDYVCNLSLTDLSYLIEGIKLSNEERP